MNQTTFLPPLVTNISKATSENSFNHMRIALSITHILLVLLGTVNLLVIIVILLRPLLRSITNVYIISLCLADFIYLMNLSFVVATQFNDKSWAFGPYICTIYHGTETTGKYASVIFVVLLAADRYLAICHSTLCKKYRTYRIAITLSVFSWFFAIIFSLPLYLLPEVVRMKINHLNHFKHLCIVKWPSSVSAKWYITFSSMLIFVIPLFLIIFYYYHIINKLKEALNRSKRMKRNSESRAPYHRVTRMVLWVVFFYVICWSPFWFFNIISSIFRLHITSQADRIIVNVIHLFPYINCALNPFLYAWHSENFRLTLFSLFQRKISQEKLINNDLPIRKYNHINVNNNKTSVLLNNSVKLNFIYKELQESMNSEYITNENKCSTLQLDIDTDKNDQFV